MVSFDRVLNLIRFYLLFFAFQSFISILLLIQRELYNWSYVCSKLSKFNYRLSNTMRKTKYRNLVIDLKLKNINFMLQLLNMMGRGEYVVWFENRVRNTERP